MKAVSSIIVDSANGMSIPIFPVISCYKKYRSGDCQEASLDTAQLIGHSKRTNLSLADFNSAPTRLPNYVSYFIMS